MLRIQHTVKLRFNFVQNTAVGTKSCMGSFFLFSWTNSPLYKIKFTLQILEQHTGLKFILRKRTVCAEYRQVAAVYTSTKMYIQNFTEVMKIKSKRVSHES